MKEAAFSTLVDDKISTISSVTLHNRDTPLKVNQYSITNEVTNA
jgi:hypothetical protein